VTVAFEYVFLLSLCAFAAGFFLGLWAENHIKKPAQRRLERAVITRALGDRRLNPLETHRAVLQDGIDLTYEEVVEILRHLSGEGVIHRVRSSAPVDAGNSKPWTYYLPDAQKRLT
jgi:hypothetical protein